MITLESFCAMLDTIELGYPGALGSISFSHPYAGVKRMCIDANVGFNVARTKIARIFPKLVLFRLVLSSVNYLRGIELNTGEDPKLHYATVAHIHCTIPFDDGTLRKIYMNTFNELPLREDRDVKLTGRYHDLTRNGYTIEYYTDKETSS
jgi:hypothetical protein